MLKKKIDRGIFLSYEVIGLGFVADEFLSIKICLEDSPLLACHE